MEKLQNLLNKVHKVVLIEQQRQTEKRERGECFNIFDVLGLNTNETRTHSAFLAELLNPNGTHGLKGKFFELFLQETETSLDFDIQSAKVEIEFSIGQKNEDMSEGGRIDILITDKNSNAIVIENKIYAGDQPKQLLRYHSYVSKNHPQNFRLLYLTLDGSEPSESSSCGLKTNSDFYCISYEDHILSWLNKCVSTSYANPLIRETIVQYINLIKVLTKKSMDTTEKKELIDILKKDPESVKAIYNVIEEYENTLVKECILDVLAEWAKKEGLKCGTMDNNIIERKMMSGFWVAREEWKEWTIMIYTEHNNLKSFYIGIASRISGTQEKHQQLTCLKESPTDYWPYGWQHLYDTQNDFRNWDESIMPQIANGEVAKFIINWIEEIMSEIEEKKIEL